MRKLLITISCLITVLAVLPADAGTPGSSSFISASENGKSDRYACIQIHRGDKIELTGWITPGATSEETLFKTVGGRTFILKGDLVQKLSGSQIQKDEKLNIKGTVVFEGREDRCPELALTEFHPLNE